MLFPLTRVRISPCTHFLAFSHWTQQFKMTSQSLKGRFALQPLRNKFFSRLKPEMVENLSFFRFASTWTMHVNGDEFLIGAVFASRSGSKRRLSLPNRNVLPKQSLVMVNNIRSLLYFRKRENRKTKWVKNELKMIAFVFCTDCQNLIS